MALKTATVLGTAVTACAVATTVQTVFAPMTFAMNQKIAKSTLLTLTLSVVIALLLTMTLTSKGR